MTTNKTWHDITKEECIKLINVDYLTGLSAAQAAERIAIYGPNELFANSSLSWVQVLISNLLNPMNFILLVGLIISCVFKDWPDAGVLGIVIVTNTLIGFKQEYSSEKTIEALKKLSSPVAKVKRDGIVDIISCPTVVPGIFLYVIKGDIVFVEEGSIVPADLRLVETVNLNIDEALLTGESLPVVKTTNPILNQSAAVGDRTNMAFKNTLVSRGRGIGVVVATGLNTEIGKIAKMVSNSEQQKSLEDINILDDPKETQAAPNRTGLGVIWGKVAAFFNTNSNKTPLQSSMNGLMFVLTAIAIILAVIVFGANSWKFDQYIVLYAVGVAIAILPEGLPAVVTVTMAVGVRKMAKQKAIVRKLAALEALGQVTNICSDKTGTLTEGKMYEIYMSIHRKGFKESVDRWTHL